MRKMKKMETLVVEAAQLGVLLIDAQPLFWGYAFPEEGAQKEAILVRLEHLLMLADWMRIPVIATFEHPVANNGELPERLEKVFPADGQRYMKKTYNCTLETTINQAITRLPVTQFAVAGAETDVCILQSVLGLLGMGYQVFILEDGLFTSEPQPGPALRRMVQAGAIPCTVKTLAYELVVSTERTPWYPEGWVDRKGSSAKPFPEKFVVPEKWPPWESVIY
jgi:nicotinamidase-related amidase